MRIRTLIASITASCLLLAASAATTLAGNITTTGGIRSGPLTLTTGGGTSLSTTLNGADLVVTGDLGTATVVDATGSGAGWHLTVTGTAFKNAAGKSLPDDALVITGVTVQKNTGRAPVNSVTYPLTVPMGASAPNGVKFVAAAPDSGMGKFTVTPAVQLTVPADSYAGDYSSTLTLSIVAGP